MNNDYDLTTKLDKEALEWVIDNYSNVEKVTPRMLMKLMDLKTSEPEDGKKWLILSLVLKNFSYSIKQKMSADFHIEKHSQYQNCTFEE